jgi:hypothetical protein
MEDGCRRPRHADEREAHAAGDQVYVDAEKVKESNKAL